MGDARTQQRGVLNEVGKDAERAVSTNDEWLLAALGESALVCAIAMAGIDDKARIRGSK
jgi:hypothetical protein